MKKKKIISKTNLQKEMLKLQNQADLELRKAVFNAKSELQDKIAEIKAASSENK